MHVTFTSLMVLNDISLSLSLSQRLNSLSYRLINENAF